MLKGWRCWNGDVEHEQWRLVWIDTLPSFPKGTLVFVFLAVLGIAALAALAVVVVVEVKKDGYRRMPERELVRIF